MQYIAFRLRLQALIHFLSLVMIFLFSSSVAVPFQSITMQFSNLGLSLSILSNESIASRNIDALRSTSPTQESR